MYISHPSYQTTSTPLIHLPLPPTKQGAKYCNNGARNAYVFIAHLVGKYVICEKGLNGFYGSLYRIVITSVSIKL